MLGSTRVAAHVAGIDCGTDRYPVRRLFCIGRNYADHARELGNAIPSEPVIFLKPFSALIACGERLPLPRGLGEVHLEAEVVVVIGEEGRARATEEADEFVAGLTLGIDLTLRDMQARLKAEGQPWEKAKAFDDSAALGVVMPYHSGIHDLENLAFEARVNGVLRQSGNTGEMLFSIRELIVEIGKLWALMPGDLIYTGTPSGVGPLAPSDRVELWSPRLGRFKWECV